LVRSGANASGTLTVKEGAQTQSFTLIGTYTTSNFSATSDGHGGTLVTDPPVISGGSVTTNTEIGSGGGSNPDIASTPSTDLGLQWLENMVESVVSDLEGLKTDGGFQQLLNRIEGWGSPGSESMPLDQMSDHSNFQVSGRRRVAISHGADIGLIRRRQGWSIPRWRAPTQRRGPTSVCCRELVASQLSSLGRRRPIGSG
jgi:hypothetical protein